MKIKQIKLSSLNNLVVDLSELKSIEPDMVLIAGSPVFFLENAGINKIFKNHFNENCIIVGCSSSGEISGPNVFDNQIIFTAIKFKKTKLIAKSISVSEMADSFAAGRGLASKFEAKLNALMVFSPGLDVNGSALIEGLRSVLSHELPITGGLAGDNAAFLKTFTLLNDRVSDRQVVAIGFIGDDLIYNYGCFGGW